MAQSPVLFLKEVRDELQKVVWPTREEAIRLTTIVIVLSLLVGLLLGGADLILTKILEIVLR